MQVHASLEDINYIACGDSNFTQLSWRYPARRETSSANKIILTDVKPAKARIRSSRVKSSDIHKNNPEKYLPLIKISESAHDEPRSRLQRSKSDGKLYFLSASLNVINKVTFLVLKQIY